MPFAQRVIPQRGLLHEIYRDNAQNILDKISVSHMIGLLQQLNQLSQYSQEVFTDLLKETDKQADRIRKCKQRIQNVDSKVASTEKIFVDNAPSYFYDHPFTEKEWQRRDPLHGLLFRRDRSSVEINRRRNYAEQAPNFSIMDQFSTNGPCSKQYSDPQFFMNEWLEAEKIKMEEEKLKRKARKKKKKEKRVQKKTIQAVKKKKYNALGAEFQDDTKADASDEVVVKSYTLSGEYDGKQIRQATESLGGKSGKGGKGSKSSKSGNALNVQSHVPQASYMQSQQMSQISQQAQKSPNNKQPPNSPPLSQRQPTKPPPHLIQSQTEQNGPPPAFAVPQNNNQQPPPIPGQQMQIQPPIPNIPQQPKKLSPMEMAMMSSQQAEQQNLYVKPKPDKPKLGPGRSVGLLQAIQSGKKLRKTETVKREIPKDARSMLLANLRKGAALKHVDEKDKNVKKEEEVDRTVHAILTRRAFLEDDSDSSEEESWGSESF